MKDTIPTIPLSDAAQLAASHSDTFEQPDAPVLRALKVGDLVKVSDFHERFWVSLTSVTPDVLEGTVDNHLKGLAGHGLKYGDMIRFQRRHVYQVDYPRQQPEQHK